MVGADYENNNQPAVAPGSPMITGFAFPRNSAASQAICPYLFRSSARRENRVFEVKSYLFLNYFIQK